MDLLAAAGGQRLHNNFWAKRYSTSTGVWTEDVKLTSGAAILYV